MSTYLYEPWFDYIEYFIQMLKNYIKVLLFVEYQYQFELIITLSKISAVFWQKYAVFKKKVFYAVLQGKLENVCTMQLLMWKHCEHIKFMNKLTSIAPTKHHEFWYQIARIRTFHILWSLFAYLH